ncbi:MAG: LysR family transcriptional regulator [Eubacterium sp.]|nr:LysR family transcriptional regulator [Eubacterium sp.]
MIDNLNYYRIFYATAKEGNISRAADRLYISQPAVSKSISLLEKELNCTLFNRSSRGVKLTEEGELLFESLSSAFQKINDAEDKLQRDLSLGVGELKIGVSNALCRHLLMDHLKNYIINNPHIKVSIDCHATINTVRLLQDNAVDIGLICETDLPSDIEFIPIKKIHDVFVASKTYLENLILRETKPEALNSSNYFFSGNITMMTQFSRSSRDKKTLGKNQNQQNHNHTDNRHKETSFKNTFFDLLPANSLTPNEVLERGNVMLLEKGNVTRNHIEKYFYQNNIIPKKILDINDMDLLLDFARIGLGISAIVKEFAEDAINDGSVILLPLNEEVPERNVGFAYKRNNTNKKIIKDFLSFGNQHSSSF